MVFTSTKISNCTTPILPDEVKEIVSVPDVEVYAHDKGNALKPSSIIDLETMEYIRE